MKKGEMMDDLISRKAAIEIASGYCHPANIAKELAKLPSAQPEPCEDTISRQAVIEALKEAFNPSITNFVKAKMAIDNLPSAQPETHEERTETHSCDCISRQAAINALTSHIMPHNNEDGTVTIGVLSKSSIKNILNKLPSAQPEHTNSCYTNSWCIDCKEYDTENKCCPRYNRVIKQTLDDAYRHGETEAEARFHDEIVRCKDCKHSRFFDPCFYCYEFGEEINIPENGFCFMAERRTDG